MAKWADFCISAVRYDTDKNHIAKLKVHPDNGDSIGFASEETRTLVVASIESGNSFITITKNDQDNWQKGEDVHVVTVDNNKYLRTDANETASDNLGSLPTF